MSKTTELINEYGYTIRGMIIKYNNGLITADDVAKDLMTISKHIKATCKEEFPKK